MQSSDDSPEPVETIATEVRLRVGELTPSERRAAHALLSNYPFAGLETVSQFAKRAGVSAPSILRFVARFGFDAYADFQLRLKQDWKRRSNRRSRAKRRFRRRARALPSLSAR
jgi:DNA-binding MurR/RpiR family transcriptional regulator